MITQKDFVGVYVPMAREGKSALEIGEALGFEGDPKTISQKVSAKATLLRKRLREEAEAAATEQKLNKKESEAFVEEVVSRLPKLNRNRTKQSVVNMLDALIEKADTPSE